MTSTEEDIVSELEHSKAEPPAPPSPVVTCDLEATLPFTPAEGKPVPDAAPPEAARVIPPTPAPEDMYLQGMAFLKGVGAARNESMAIARFLDASDLGHAEAAFKAALMYFNGVGITRNVDEAQGLAKRCLELGPSSALIQRYCKELTEGSIGTENVRRLLEQDEETILQSDVQLAQKKKATTLVLAAAALTVLFAGMGAYFYFSTQDRLDLPSAAGIASVIPPEELAQAKKDSLAAIASLRAEAAGAVQASGDAAPTRTTDF